MVLICKNPRKKAGLKLCASSSVFFLALNAHVVLGLVVGTSFASLFICSTFIPKARREYQIFLQAMVLQEALAAKFSEPKTERVTNVGRSALLQSLRGSKSPAKFQ